MFSAMYLPLIDFIGIVVLVKEGKLSLIDLINNESLSQFELFISDK